MEAALDETIGQISDFETKEKELADTIKDTINNDDDFVEDFDVEDGWDD